MLLIGLMFHMNKKQNEFEIYKVYVMYSQVNSYQNYKYSWTYRRFAYIIMFGIALSNQQLVARGLIFKKCYYTLLNSKSFV